jgi:UDP-N-acetyl-D-galactosamine dehydrogenase
LSKSRDKRVISVVGLGYVGLPVAVAFAESGHRVIGFDHNPSRVKELRQSIDHTGEVEAQRLRNPYIVYSNEPSQLSAADFHIVTVPTPIDSKNSPDLSFLLSASETVGRTLKKGDIVVYESTVYPGCTENDCLPVLERISGLKSQIDFFVGYSPERINPGDREHRFETIPKVVSAQTPKSLEIIASVYGGVIKAGIHRAPSIRVAEASKVIENTQRDLNIALINELSHIFRALNIDTYDVLAAAGTKWNFLPFEPGLVGGHCIGVDPYYLTHVATLNGVDPDIILAGRSTNNKVPQWIAQACFQWLKEQNIKIAKIAILGATFKENVPDIRNSKVPEIREILVAAGHAVDVLDHYADPRAFERAYGYQCQPLDVLLDENFIQAFDIIILAVPHTSILENCSDIISRIAKPNRCFLMDLKGKLNREHYKKNIDLWRL